MARYVDKEAVLSICDSIWNDADETTQSGVDIINAMDKITDFIESLPSADVQPVDRWIDAQKNPPPVVDRRSMTSESVLILRDNGRCAVAYYCFDAKEGSYWTTDDDKTMYEWEEVSHWQPLPKHPKDGEKMKEMYDDENMNDVACSIYQFLSNEQYTTTDLLKIIIDVIENRLR